MLERTVLVIDDDPDIRGIVNYVLNNHFKVLTAESLNEGGSILKKSKVDLLVLDEMLPDGSGSEFCSQLRTSKSDDVPVIMLTKRDELKDKLMAFHNGADDYVIKPFEPLELLARVNARLKCGQDEGSANIIHRGDLKLDLTTQTVERIHDGVSQSISLTPIEFRILYFIAKEPGEIYDRAQILEAVWGKQQHVIERTVDQHMSKLRKKIYQSDYTVKSLHKKGYLFMRKGQIFE